MSRWRPSPFPPWMFHPFFFVLTFPFPPTEPIVIWQREEKSWSSSSEASPQIKKPTNPIPPAASPYRDRQAAGEEWEKCHLLIKDAPDSRWGLTESLERRAGPAYIVTHLGDVFYLGAAGRCEKPAARAHAATSTALWGKDLLSLSIRETDINYMCWASSWLFWLVFYRGTASDVVSICLLQSGNVSCLSRLQQHLIAEFFM